MTGRNPNSLGYYQSRGVSITAYCENDTRPPCRHSAVLPLDALIAKFGEDFEVPKNYARFIASLSCSECGGKKVSIRLGSPPFAGGFNGIGGHGRG